MSISYIPGQGYKTLRDIRKGIADRLGKSPQEQNSLEVEDPQGISSNEDSSRDIIQQMLSQSASASNVAVPDLKPQSLMSVSPLQPLNNQDSELFKYVAEREGGESSGGVSEAKFVSNLDRFLAAAGGKITVNSQKRTSQRQTELWQQALKKYGDPAIARKWVAPPAGYKMPDGSVAQGSKHEHGVAADLGYANDAARKWAHENAAKYGLHFPLGNEPWHIEIQGSRR